MTRLENAKKQIKKQFNVNLDDYIIKDDYQAWTTYNKYNYLYDKMFLAKLEELKYSPMPIEPKEYPVIIKPIINLHQTGIKSKLIYNKTQFFNNYLSTDFWVEYLKGEIYNWNIVARQGKIIYFVCFKGNNNNSKFGSVFYYELINENLKIPNNIKKLIQNNLKDYTGNINIKIINNKIISIKLKMCHMKQLPVKILKLVIFNLIIKNKNYDKIIKNAFKNFPNSNLNKIYLIPVLYKIKNIDNINKIYQYLLINWEKKIIQNKKIFQYSFDNTSILNSNGIKKWFSFSTEYLDEILKLKYDIEYDLIKTFG